jgi:hypothetical protein
MVRLSDTKNVQNWTDAVVVEAYARRERFELEDVRSLSSKAVQ